MKYACTMKSFSILGENSLPGHLSVAKSKFGPDHWKNHIKRFFTLFLKTFSHPGIYHRTFKLSTSSTFNLLLFAMGDSGLSWTIKASHKCYFQYCFTVHSEISFIQLHHLVQARPWLCLVCNMISTQHLKLYSWRILPASTAVFPASNALALRKSSTCP